MFSVNGTYEKRLGKYINHSSKQPNCVPKAIKKGKLLFICLFALKDIEAGTELRYDYGVRGLDWQQVCVFDIWVYT